MGEKGEGSGVVGGGKWGRRGREVGGKGEGTGNGVPPVHPLNQRKSNLQYLVIPNCPSEYLSTQVFQQFLIPDFEDKSK